jgi:tetratricopeptide (TPR) repeat protein
MLGDPQKGLEYLLEGLQICRQIGDKRLIAAHLDGLAECYFEIHQPETAKRHLEEAILIQKELGDQQGLAYSLTDLGIVAWIQADYPLCQTMLDKSLAIRQKIGDKNGEGSDLCLLGINAFSQKEYNAALKYFKDGLTILLPLGDERNIVNCIEGLGHVALGVGNPIRAVKLWAATQAWRERVGTPVRGFFQPFHQTQIVKACQLLGDEMFKRVWDEGSMMTSAQALAYADQPV